MSENAPDIEKLFLEGHRIDEAIRKGAYEALKAHRRAGVPLAIWRHGQVVWVSPDEFERGLHSSGSA